MPTRDGYAEGIPSWTDLSTTDVAGAKEFYTTLFGWEYREEETDSAPYSMATKKGLSAAGIGELQTEGHPPVWSTYFAVSNADATAAKVKDAGGRVLLEPFDVTDAGRMAIVSDPTGAVFGIWQAGNHFGAAIVNEHGALNWNELLTDDTEKALAFYQEVFGHEIEVSTSLTGSDYFLIKVGDRGVAGAMAKPMAEIPNHWGVYFAVDDVAKTIVQATENGGSLVHGPQEIPEVGTFAGLVDPYGSNFTVIQLASEVD